MRKPGKKTSDGSVLYGLLVGGTGSVVSVKTCFGKIFVGEIIAYTRTSKSDRELALGGQHLHSFEDGIGGEPTPLSGTVLLRESQIEYILLFDQKAA